MAPVLKTGESKDSVGSNPTPSADVLTSLQITSLQITPVQVASLEDIGRRVRQHGLHGDPARMGELDVIA